MFDPDEYDERIEKVDQADKLCAKLLDCDLAEWDQDFVDDMVKRITRFGSRTTISARQEEQLERMRKQYAIKD